jgi:hypothetical protein
MADAILALTCMFLFGLACGMMLRDWQSERRAARLRQVELKAQRDRVCASPPDKLPVPKIPTW